MCIAVIIDQLNMNENFENIKADAKSEVFKYHLKSDN